MIEEVARIFRANTSGARLLLVAAFALPLVLAFALYVPSLSFDYVWDDRVLFVDSSTLRLDEISWANVTRPLFGQGLYVRPFAILSFMAQFKWFGPTPVISHAVNLALYLANVGMVMMLARIHCSRRMLHSGAVRVFTAGLLYALHPALIESAAWASGRFDLLATTCVLAALIADLCIKSAPLRAVAVAAAFGLGLGSKELVIVLPVLLVAQRSALDAPTGDLSRYWKDLLQQERWTAFICMLVAAVYILVRLGATSGLLPPVSVREALSSPGMRLAYVLDTLGFYLQQGLAPWWGQSSPLHPAHAAAVLSPSRLPRIVAGLAFGVAVLVSVTRRYYTGWMLACALACLLPVLNIVILPLADNIGCDRFLTLPLAFAALAIAGTNPRWIEGRARLKAFGLTAVIALWVINSLGMVRSTVPRWKDDLALWSSLYANPATQTAATWNLVAAAMRAGRYEIALDVLQRRLSLGPLEAEQQAVYGLALAHRGDPKEGMAYISGAMRAYPPTPYAPPNWREERGASAMFRDRLGYAHYAMAEAMVLSDMKPQALESAEKAAKYRPAMLEALVLRGALRKTLGKPDPDALSVRAELERTYPPERERLERDLRTLHLE